MKEHEIEEAAKEYARAYATTNTVGHKWAFEAGAHWALENAIKLIEVRKEQLDMRIDTMWELDELIDKLKDFKT